MADLYWLPHIVLAWILIGLVEPVKECKTIDSCRCSTDEGEIDLHKLVGTGGRPRFPSIGSSITDFTFSWNPCESYSSGGCSHIAACFVQKSATRTYYHDIATQDTSHCVLVNSQCALNYTGMGPKPAGDSFLSVILKCDPSKEGQVDPMNVNTLSNSFGTVLYSKYACPSAKAGASGLSLGSVLLIVFACIIILYIVCGFLINKYSRHIDGKEAFPNYSFWADFPLLVKDGCIFTYHSCRNLCGQGRSGYATI